MFTAGFLAARPDLDPRSRDVVVLDVVLRTDVPVEVARAATDTAFHEGITLDQWAEDASYRARAA